MRAEIGESAGSCPLAAHVTIPQRSVPAAASHLRFKLINRCFLQSFLSEPARILSPFLNRFIVRLRIGWISQKLAEPHQKSEK
jgi:hypothetical protein